MAIYVVVTPHPDDEILGVGGYCRYMRDQGHDVRIVLLTRGEASWTVREKCLSQNERYEEWRRADSYVASSIWQADPWLTDGQVTVAQALAIMEWIRDSWNPAMILTTVDDSKYQAHNDHDNCAEALRQLTGFSGYKRWFRVYHLQVAAAHGGDCSYGADSIGDYSDYHVPSGSGPLCNAMCTYGYHDNADTDGTPGNAPAEDEDTYMSVSNLFDHKDCDTSRDPWSCYIYSHPSGAEDVSEIYDQTCHKEYHFFQSVAP